MREIFYNGKVYAGKDHRESAFVCEDGKFLYVGDDAQALAYAREGDHKTDLDGKFVVPGFNDSHMHLISLGNSLNMVDLYDAASIDDLVSKGKAFMEGKTYPENHFIMGFGWNDDYFREKRFPTRYDLDRISTEYPVCFIRACYHVYVVNSRALELIGVDRNTAQVDGGVFDLDENGEPLGIFRENACGLVIDNITALEFDEIQKCITDGVEFCNSMGITSIGTDDLSEFGPVSAKTIIKAFTELEDAGKLKARVSQQSRFHSFEEYQEFLADGYRTGSGKEFFKIGPLKLITDGSLGARTAYMKEPYADDPTTQGVLSMDPETLEKWVRCGHDHGMQIAIHAIGDGAVRNVLDAYEKIIGQDKPNNFRHGIVHSQITDAEAIRRMKEMSLIAYIQTIFLDYDVTIAADRLGEKVKDSYKFATLIHEGIPCSNGSDSPVDWPDVLKGIQLAITRKSITSETEPFFTEEAMTLDECLYSFTKAGAYSTFEEDTKGAICAGEVADFVLFREDLFDVDVMHLKDVRPLETWLGGNRVWSAK